MDHDNAHDDLTALFEMEDGMLASDGFVDRVMTPIRKRTRGRQALLFAAGGIGVGAAVSQLTGFASSWRMERPDVSGTLPAIREQIASLASVNPVWLLTIVMVIVCVGLLTAMERT